MIVAQVRRTLVERALVERASHVLVACSGGVDSTAMAHVLARLARPIGYTMTVAAVDHGLRPEAAQEVVAVGRLADSLGVPFRPLRVTVDSSRSVQAAARRARYAALSVLAAEIGAKRVAVGHTQDDQAETVLARMLRGSGVAGLAAIAPRRRDGVIRPLIDVRRAEARAYAAAQSLDFVEDPSNVDPRYLRTPIRSELLPWLEREDPSVVSHLAALADEARATRRQLRGRARLWLERARVDGGLSVARLLRAPAAVRTAALRHWGDSLVGRRLGRRHVEALEALLTGPSESRAEVLLGAGWAARRSGPILCAEQGRHRPTRSARRL